MSQLIEISDQKLFDEIAEKYAQKDIAPTSRVAREYQTKFLVSGIAGSGKKLGIVLEIACGVAATAKYLHGQYDRFIGVDYSQEMIRMAKWFNADTPHCEFSAMNVKDIQNIGTKVDTVVAIGALHHMQDLDLVMQRLKSVCRHGATVVALEPYNGNPFIQLLRKIRTIVDKSYSADQVFFSNKELLDLFTRNGFVDVEVTNCNFLTSPFAQVIMPATFLTLPLAKIAVGVDSFLDKHLKGLRFLSWNVVVKGKLP
jgi:2-polyprenyl-3-methyl-5-hydroxy-6-metoxy-1,4-benzoquinol methylase